jgi:lipopolysaccharide biosynthesis glycosyltransferase
VKFNIHHNTRFCHFYWQDSPWHGLSNPAGRELAVEVKEDEKE